MWDTCHNHNPVVSLFVTYHWSCNKTNAKGITSGAGSAYPLGAHEFNPSFSGVRLCSTLSFLHSVLYTVFFSLSPLNIVLSTSLVCSKYSSIFFVSTIMEFWVWDSLEEEFGDIKGVIRIRVSKKNRHHNDQVLFINRIAVSQIIEYCEIILSQIN